MNRIKAYLEEQIKTDEALRAVYDEKKLAQCWAYITSQAKKQAKNNCACIEDTVVYHWARDFYFGDTVKTESSNSPAPEDIVTNVVPEKEESENVTQTEETSAATVETASETTETVEESAKMKFEVVEEAKEETETKTEETTPAETSQEVQQVTSKLDVCAECVKNEDGRCKHLKTRIPHYESCPCFVSASASNAAEKSKKQQKEEFEASQGWLFDFE